jgi:hypothetical protein
LHDAGEDAQFAFTVVYDPKCNVFVNTVIGRYTQHRVGIVRGPKHGPLHQCFLSILRHKLTSYLRAAARSFLALLQCYRCILFVHILVGQFVEQRLGFLEVGGVEALGEPVVDLGEHRARFVALALLVE